MSASLPAGPDEAAVGVEPGDCVLLCPNQTYGRCRFCREGRGDRTEYDGDGFDAGHSSSKSASQSPGFVCRT